MSRSSTSTCTFTYTIRKDQSFLNETTTKFETSVKTRKTHDKRDDAGDRYLWGDCEPVSDGGSHGRPLRDLPLTHSHRLRGAHESSTQERTVRTGQSCLQRRVPRQKDTPDANTVEYPEVPQLDIYHRRCILYGRHGDTHRPTLCFF